MSQIGRIGLLTATILITIATLSTPLPLAKNDIIHGQEFLSLYISNQPPETRRQFAEPPPQSQKIHSHDHPDASRDDIETAESSYDTRYSRPATISIESAVEDEEDGNSMTSYLVNGTKVIELVTTGSKIVFLEDEVNQTTSRQTQQNDVYDSSNLNQPADEIKVISISVSSSARRNHGIREDNEYPVDEHLGAHDESRTSRLGNSQLSIEEDDSYVEEKSHSDSMRDASLKLERILAPSDGQVANDGQSGRSRRPIVSLSDDELSPIKGLVIHDPDYQKGGGARPRSVSYSSITQSVNDKVWRGTIVYNHTHPAEHDDTIIQAKYDSELHAKPQPQYNQAHYPEPEKVYSEPAKVYSEASKVYGEPSKIYSEPAKVYSEPAKVYSEPEKIYSEPAKVYSEPARIYSEPAKVYSKPAKVYGEPSRVYGEPSKVYSNSPNIPTRPTTKKTTTTTQTSILPTATSTTSAPRTASVYYSEHQVSPVKRVIFNLDKLPYDLLNAPVSDDNKNYLFAPQLDTQRFHHFNRKSQDQQFQSKHQLPPERTTTPHFESSPEKNYEVDEAVSVMTNGRKHHSTSDKRNESPTSSEDPDSLDESKSDDSVADGGDPKVGFVVEGRNFRKYRVEEKTSDGFIVGEYGVVSTNDGSLRGVRYTADSNISPNLIYEALMKFLAL